MSFAFRFLGTGTSQGVPLIGKEYPEAYLANPRNHRLRASIYVETPSARVVVDTTPDFRTQMLREKLGHLDAVIITHAHADHIMGMDDCRRICDLRGGPLPVHATEETFRSLRRVFDYAFGGHPIPFSYFHPLPRVIDGPFEIGDLRIVPFQLPHGRITTTGLIFEQGGPGAWPTTATARRCPRPRSRRRAGSRWPCWMRSARNPIPRTCASTRR